MQLDTFTPRPPQDMGDKFTASDAVDKPLVVLVREHRTGIITKFKPEGGDGVVVDVADVRTNEIYLNVLWMNGAIVDNLAGYVGKPVAIKLTYQAPKGGGNSYITVVPLDGTDLALAQQWATSNTNRFDTERVARAQQANADTTTTVTAPTTTVSAPTPVTTSPSSGADDPMNNPAVQALLAQIAAKQTA